LTGVRDENGFQTETNGYSGDGPHQLNKRDGVDYTYDERGRLYKSSEGLAIEYTDFDLPKSYTKDNVTTDFNYDAGHHRVRKAGPSGTTITLGGLYERREDAGGTKHVFNIGGPDGMIAQVVYDQGHESEEVEYLHQDQLGSVAVATSPEGKEIDRLFYEPFGRRIDKHGNPLAGPASDVLTGFTGQRHDDDLGLIDMRGRTYDPILRRFLQPDPVIQDAYEGQNYNRYSYVTNDPVNLIDPTGFTAKKLDDGDIDPTGGTPESYDKDNAKLNSPEIVVTAGPEAPADHLGTDNNGEGAAVQGEAALADTSYQSSSTDQGLNTGGGGGSGGGPTTGPTGLCSGCQDTDAFSYFYRYGGYVQRGLLYTSGALVVAAGAVFALPGMAIGGLSTGGAGLIGGATVVTVPAVGAASAVALAANTPTGQVVLEEAEGEGADVARQVIATLPDKLFQPFQCKECASAIVDALTEQGIGGQVLNFTSNGRSQFMVNELVDVGTPITTNGTHQAVQVGEVVFDNYFRGGVSYDSYLEGLQAPSGVALVKTPF
jgi:RHS repeat-associated protein